MSQIAWVKDYPAARQAAEQAGKLLLVDFFSPQ